MSGLTFTNVTKIYETPRGPLTVLDDVTLSVRPNEFVCLVGASGCGKSTLLQCAAGLNRPTSGEVALDGERVVGPSAERGMIFQGYTLFPWLTVEQNVGFGLALDGVSARARAATVARYLDVVGLTKFAKAYPKTLSGGMQQRVAIARGLANEPAVLLMDEPFGALDAQTRTIMQEFLLDLWRTTHISILFVTHDVEEAVYLGERVYVLRSHPGRVREERRPELGNDRDRHVKRTAAFHACVDDVLDLLHDEALASAS
ncbi:MAG: ABC transporter ATP-binding protein [Vulcanimicrobiaceae bacterium]